VFVGYILLQLETLKLLECGLFEGRFVAFWWYWDEGAGGSNAGCYSRSLGVISTIRILEELWIVPLGS